MSFLNFAADTYRTQFEWDGGRLLFRRSGKGRGVVVTESEMIEAVEAYQFRVIILMALGFILSAISIALALWLAPRESLVPWLVGALMGSTVVSMLPYSWAYRSPTAHFASRMPSGEDRTSEQLKREALSEFGLTEAGFMLLGGSAVMLKMDHWPPVGFDWLLTLPVVAIAIFIAWIGWRKRSLGA
jgi:hypothetical protein